MSRIQITTPAIRFSLAAALSLIGIGAGAEQLHPVAASVQFVASSEAKFRLTIATPDLAAIAVATPEGDYDQFQLDGETTISREGWPDLPVISRTILIPSKGAVKVNNLSVDSRSVEGLKPLAAPPADRDDPGAGVPSNEFLTSSGWFPAAPVEVGEPAILRGYRLVTVYAFPVRYDPATGLTQFNDHIEFDLEFSGAGVNEITDLRRIPPSLSARRAIENLVVNPPLPGRDEILGGNYLYVYPRVDGVPGAIAPLIEWRKRMGHRVSAVEINNPTAASVMNAVRNAYAADDPVEFVCLIGDATVGLSQVIIPAATQFGDYEYSRLDGNDVLPDVAIGRISAASVNQLASIVNKIVSYESDPYMDDTDWFKEAAVVAGHVENGIGEVHLARWVKSRLLDYGYDEVRGWFWDVDGEIGGNQPWLSQQFDQGIGVLHYRAFSHMNQLPLAVITNLPNGEGRWPAVLMISCNTGNFVQETNGNYQGIGQTEEMLRARGGGIGAIGTSTGNTNVRFNNLVAAGVWKGVYQLEMYCLGWGLNQGKYEIWRAYGGGFDDEYTNFMDWNNLMGDPGTAIWTDIPLVIDVSHPQQVPVSSNLVVVDVSDREDNPVADARVTIYRAGELQITALTNHDGRAFVMLPEGIEAGVAGMTVVKHNVRPYLGDFNFIAPNQSLAASNFEIDDDDEGESSGDGDGIANPNERLEIGFTLANGGQNPVQGAVTITGISDSPWITIPEAEIQLDEAPGEDDLIDLVLAVEMDPAAPDGAVIPLRLDIRAGQTLWRSAFEFNVEAPKIMVTRNFVEGDSFEPGDVKEFDIEITNIGNKILDASTVTLTSDNPAISVIDEESSYPRMAIDGVSRTAGGLFRLRSHPMTIPGTKTTMTVIVETEAGFRDQAEFEFTLNPAGDGDPFGPDSYGYVCYDSEDEGWEMTPTFDWIEINRALQNWDFRGTNLNLTDMGDNEDTARVINLPFDFQYYGQVFEQITICSNGWAAFGDQDEIANFRNQHIGQALAPEAMLAVWWDNLKTIDNTSAIYYHHDQNGGRFIVEWSQMRRLVEGGAGAVETFEIILYDPAVHPTSTGDGIITFQYLDVTNENARAHNDIPYCTIGISNLDGSGGLEYTYWNTYTRGAETIDDQMAITFATQPLFITGTIEGTIVDAATNEPIVGATVISTRGFWGETDGDGFYRIDDILIGEDYTLTASAPGWNDSTLVGFDVAEDDVIEVNFSLLHPEIRPSIAEIDEAVRTGESEERRFRLFNEGNGTLEWESRPLLIQDDEPLIWQLRESIEIGQIAQDDRVEGAVFVNDKFYACGANGDGNNMIYIVNRNGELEGEFEQFGHARYGFKDLEWDGELIWGSNEDTIYGFTPEGELAKKFLGLYNPNSSIAYDSDRDWLWVSSITSNIRALTRDGEEVGRIINRNSLRIYGLSYAPEDPAGKPLYIHTLDGEVHNIYRVDPEAGNSELYYRLEPPGPGLSTGAAVTGLYDPYNWTYISVINNNLEGGDRLDLYNLGPRTSWMKPTPALGTLEAGEAIDIVLTLDAIGLPPMELFGDLNFLHNAAGGSLSLPVNLTVFAGEGAPDMRTWALDRGWNLVSLNITPETVDIRELMAPLVESDQLVVMKDGVGRFYLPENDFNNIPAYDSTQAYQIYVTEAAQIDLNGIIMEPDSPIGLNNGWNMIAYFPRDPVDAVVALTGIDDQLVVAKNGAGDFYLPAWEFNGLGAMSEGNGYQIKVNEAVELRYQIGERAAIMSPPKPSVKHFVPLSGSGINHSLLLIGETDLAEFEVAIVTSKGDIAGAGCFDKFGYAGFPVWGDDSTTEESEGLRIGEPFRIVLWDGTSEREIDFEVIEGDEVWKGDGLTVAKAGLTAMPVEFGLQGAFPNPFNSTTRLTFGLAQAGEASLAVYDLVGRRVALLASGRLEAGRHAVVWDGGAIPSGLYLVRLESAGKVETRKVALVR